MNNIIKGILFQVLITFILASCQNNKNKSDQAIQGDIFISPLGKELIVPLPSEKTLKQYEKAKQDYESEPSVENYIWFGRRTAYLGEYDRAIKIYTEGIAKFPKDARLYRHRGHRYISIRNFNAAIQDLEKAAKLIQGTENEIEPDGMPNAKNIPVSTLHGNIYYHLGLAHYLDHNYERAYKAYLDCRETGDNGDNIVSSTHWLYMIQRRLGNTDLAEEMLEPIKLEAEIIENDDYYKLCKFYKDLIPIDSIQINVEGSPSSDAVKYGLANWYFYNGDIIKSREMMEELMNSKSWSSFGYIAAESDLKKYFLK